MIEITFEAEIGERLRQAERAVVFSGAGLSKESGLDTFRGPGGLWERMRPEELATPEAFAADPDKVWRWYAWRYDQVERAEPNAAHYAVSRLAEFFPSLQVVTQNVDGLHQKAGSTEVLELHGTIVTARCTRCGRLEPMATAITRSSEAPPSCLHCERGRMRPNVVWFGEVLPDGVFEAAVAATHVADLFVVVGTSATVYPAAGLIEIAHRAGAVVVEVNVEATPLSSLADLVLAAPAGEILPRFVDHLRSLRTSGAPRRE